jgi:hypothetical protein
MRCAFYKLLGPDDLCQGFLEAKSAVAIPRWARSETEVTIFKTPLLRAKRFVPLFRGQNCTVGLAPEMTQRCLFPVTIIHHTELRPYETFARPLA